ncbi:MAG: hypothetical protein CSA21_04245 [Deltaproteobacteria bacterium]|nr:MAG: hypothetical protein CSA21_04245 [Deltaproteobacteria bacterium]
MSWLLSVPRFVCLLCGSILCFFTTDFLLIVSAVHAQPGDMLWNVTTESSLFSSPAIGADGTIYVGSEDKHLYAFYPNGTHKWKAPTKAWISFSSPAIGRDETIYIGGANELYAFHPNGTQKWNATAGRSTLISSPAIGGDDTIYIGTKDRNLYAFHPNGTQKWNATTQGSIVSSPAVGPDETVYVGSRAGLYAFYPNGTCKWNTTTERYIASSPAIGSDGTIYVGSLSSYVFALYPNGTQKWNATTQGPIHYSSPAIGPDGTIYVGSEDKHLYAFSSDGIQKWNATTQGRVLSSPAIGADGTIYVGSVDARLYAFSPDGTQKWNAATKDEIVSSPAIGPDGTLYIGSTDSRLYAFEGASGGLADTSWPMFRQNNAHTGRLPGAAACVPYVTITDTRTRDAAWSDAANQGYDVLSKLFCFNATITDPTQSVGVFRFLTHSLPTGKVSDVVLLKCYSNGKVATHYDTHDYADQAETADKPGIPGGKWWLTRAADDTYVKDSHTVSKGTGYYVYFTLQDNSPYDEDPAVGRLADPVGVAVVDDGTSNGGCTLAPGTGHGLEWLLLLAGLGLPKMRRQRTN